MSEVWSEQTQREEDDTEPDKLRCLECSREIRGCLYDVWQDGARHTSCRPSVWLVGYVGTAIHIPYVLFIDNLELSRPNTLSSLLDLT